KLRAISRVVARLTLLRSSPRYLQRITKHNKHASTTAGKSPPVKSAAIETPVTEPMVMRTKLGGIVSVCAPVADTSGQDLGFWPRVASFRGKAPAPPPPCRQLSSRKFRRPNTCRQPERNAARLGHGQRDRPRSQPGRGPCRSFR